MVSGRKQYGEIMYHVPGFPNIEKMAKGFALNVPAPKSSFLK